MVKGGTMKITLLVLALFLTCGVAQKPEIKLEVGSVLPAEYVPKNNLELYMTHSAQLRPFIQRDVAGITYVIAYDEESHVIKYISTSDRRFKSADGLQVGGYVDVDNKELTAYPGWEIRGPEDKYGWHPLIGFNSGMTVLDGDKDTKIELNEYQLESEHSVKAKIIAFVKGGN
jgi:hypothetical protein